MDLHTAVERVGLIDHETGRLDGAGLIERFITLAPARRSMSCDSIGWTCSLRMRT